MKLTTERLEEIKDGNYLLYGTEEWTTQEDAETEAVILELIAAYEASQQRLAEAQQTIRIAYSGVLEKGYSIEATLKSYMNIHNLEEW